MHQRRLVSKETVYEFEINCALHQEHKCIRAKTLEEAEKELERTQKDQNATYELNTTYSSHRYARRQSTAKYYQKRINEWYIGLLTLKELAPLLRKDKEFKDFLNELYIKGYKVETFKNNHDENECRVYPTLDSHFT